jgi:hypothetical protein
MDAAALLTRGVRSDVLIPIVVLANGHSRPNACLILSIQDGRSWIPPRGIDLESAKANISGVSGSHIVISEIVVLGRYRQ